MLFTDIVDSTAAAERLGDQWWTTVLDVHDEAARGVVEGNGGAVIKTTGAGILRRSTDREERSARLRRSRRS